MVKVCLAIVCVWKPAFLRFGHIFVYHSLIIYSKCLNATIAVKNLTLQDIHLPALQPMQDPLALSIWVQFFPKIKMITV